MKKLLRTKSILLLMIFVCYTILSCVPSTANEMTVARTIDRIQDRLENKDYTSLKPEKSLHQEAKNEMANVMVFLRSNGTIKGEIPRTLKVNFKGERSPFQFANFRPIDESISLGIDDPASFDQMVLTATEYHNGSYTYQQVLTSFTNLNNLLLNYPVSYSGGNQFLTDRVSDGTISAQQRTILEAEINALLNATSENEVVSIINTVNYELSNSQFPPPEIEQITRINAGIEGMIALQIAKTQQNQTDNYVFQKTGVAAGIIGGLAMIAVGYILVQAGNDGLGQAVGYIGAAIFAITFLYAWGKQ